MDSRIKKLSITKIKGDVVVQAPWITNLGNEDWIYVTINVDGINIAATGTLNSDGFFVLQNVLKIAEVISICDSCKFFD